jgi:hypothetical protein
VTALSGAEGAETGERTELQQSIFALPPGSAPAKEANKNPDAAKKHDTTTAGTKRPREEEDDAPMDEDDDDEGADMEMDESD